MGEAKSQRFKRGFTLLELIILLAVLAVSLRFTGAAFTASLAEARSYTAMRHLASLFMLARHEALLRGEAVTLCAVNRDGACQRDWRVEHRIAAFLDRNGNRRLDPADLTLREIRWPLQQGELSWRASLARRYIRFEETGGTWQNGTLYYCPASRDARQARALVLSHSGRTYLPGDSNGDGIREDRSGRNLRC